MNFAEAFEAPIVEKVRGVDISFPVLEIDDYATWISELTAAKRDVGRKTIPKAVDPVTKLPTQIDSVTKWTIDQRIENIEASLEDVAAKIWTVEGAKRILDISLQKLPEFAPIKDDKAGNATRQDARQQIIKRVRPQRINALAAEVSALFEARPPEEKAGQTPPNSLTPEASQAPGATGSTTESSSTDTAAVTPAA